MPTIDEIRLDVIKRWQIPDWKLHFPWWPRPAGVKILFYADGVVRFDGGLFLGLKQVIATLTANHYPWVRFDVTTVHRNAGVADADHSGLDLADALALADFDELWIYSANAGPQLTPTELAAAAAFMDAHQGGVLITGDHADLGAAFGNLPRAGAMRLLPAPPAAPPTWNSTLQPGHNPLFEFEDQSDEIPQPLRLKRYRTGPLTRAPHQLLCTQLGPIDIFPDHQHEGEAVAPNPAPVTDWPSGHPAEVIAWGRINDPSSNSVGREIGVLSAYEGHQVGVGRIVADSTWHHHFDINLRGNGMPTRDGFVAAGTADWLPAAQKIEHFFVNSGIWLAPPAKQQAMRAAAWWPILWSNEIFEALDLPNHLFGRAALDALGRYAPPCVAISWVLPLLPKLRIDHVLPDPPPHWEHVAGVATRMLIEEFGVSPLDDPAPCPDAEDVNRVIERAVEPAFIDMLGEAEAHLEKLRAVVERIAEPVLQI